MTDDEKNEVLTVPQQIEIKRSGHSDTLRLPAIWRKTLKELQGPRVICEGRVEKTPDGRVLIVFERVHE